MVRYITPVHDEPLTFEASQGHPLRAWQEVAEAWVRHGTGPDFPALPRAMTAPEAEAGFKGILSLTKWEPKHSNPAAAWAHIWQHWNPEWGHAQSKQLQSPGKMWIDALVDPDRARRTGAAHALSGWLAHPKLWGPVAHLWPKATTLTPWEQTSEHWAHVALTHWLQAQHQEKALPSGKRPLTEAWGQLMEQMDAVIAPMAATGEWPSHWRVWYEQERTWADPTRTPSPTLMPLHRPLFSSMAGPVGPTRWVSMKIHWIHKMIQDVSRPNKVLADMRRAKACLMDSASLPGESELINRFTRAMAPHPLLRAAWEQLMIESVLPSPTPGRRVARTRL